MTIPDSVTSIGAWAFDDCGSVTLKVNPGSYAEQYAENNNIPFTWPDASTDWLNW